MTTVAHGRRTRRPYSATPTHGRDAGLMRHRGGGLDARRAARTTRARRVDGGWLVNGRTHFITGADGAGFFIVMARTSGEPGDSGGATMFLAPADAAGITVFGSRLSDLGMAQQLIADNEIDLAATRALLAVACAELDAGGRASKATSIAKTFAAEALGRVVDRAMQLCGGLGVSRDLPIAKIARELRPFRIYDGPSEVHRWSIAKRAVRDIVESVR